MKHLVIDKKMALKEKIQEHAWKLAHAYREYIEGDEAFDMKVVFPLFEVEVHWRADDAAKESEEEIPSAH